MTTVPAPDLADVAAAAPARVRVRAVVVATLFLGLLVGTGAVDLAHPFVSTRLKVGTGPEPTFADGGLMREAEAELQRRSRVGIFFRSPYSGLLYGTLGAVRLGVVGGKDGVLYFRERLEYRPGSTDEVAGPVVARIAAVERRFRERDARLVPMLVPEKELVLPENLPRGVRPREDLYRRVVDELAARGVPTPDVLPLLRAVQAAGERVATRTDTHWTGKGALVAIEAAAAAAGLAKAPAARATRMTPALDIPDCGDLLYFNGMSIAALVAGGIDVDLARRGTPMERLPVYLKTTPDGAPALRLAPPPPPARLPLALAGTSFSIHEYLYDVGEMLSSATDLPVKTFTYQAIGPVWPLRILHGTTDPLPATTVWEIPTSFAFSGARALDGLEYLLGVMPPYRYDVVAALPDGPRPRRRLERATGTTHTWRLPPGRIGHEGRGAVFVRLVGKVEDAPADAFVTVDGGEPLGVRWPAGHTEFFLPLLAPGATTDGLVTLYADPATVEIERVEIVVDVAPRAAAVARVGAPTTEGAGHAQAAEFSPPVAPSERALLHLKLARDPASSGAVEVGLEAADGRRHDVYFRAAAPDADLFVDPTPLGAPVARVIVRARGPAPAGLLRAASLRPLYR